MMRAVALAVAVAVAGPVPTPPPTAVPKPVTDTYFGVPVTDPYRYFENPKSEQSQRFFKQQSDYTEAVLARIPAREKVRQLLRKLEPKPVAGGRRIEPRRER